MIDSEAYIMKSRLVDLLSDNKKVGEGWIVKNGIFEDDFKKEESLIFLNQGENTGDALYKSNITALAKDIVIATQV